MLCLACGNAIPYSYDTRHLHKGCTNTVSVRGSAERCGCECNLNTINIR